MTNESTAIKGGYRQLTGAEIREKLVGKRVLGDYLYGYKYIGEMHPDGTVEGENNVNVSHKGEWFIDAENNTLTFKWKEGWDNWTARAYDVDGVIKFFDISTGDWRTSFTEILNA